MKDHTEQETRALYCSLLCLLLLNGSTIHVKHYFIPPVAKEHVLQVGPWQMFFYFERRMIPRSQSNYYDFCQVIYTDGWATKITFHPKTKESVVLYYQRTFKCIELIQVGCWWMSGEERTIILIHTMALCARTFLFIPSFLPASSLMLLVAKVQQSAMC